LLLGKFLRLSFHDCVGGCDGELFVLEELGMSRAFFLLKNSMYTRFPITHTF
jgi:hypothetical protein